MADLLVVGTGLIGTSVGLALRGQCDVVLSDPSAADLAVAVASPAIAPRRDEIVRRIAELLGVDAGRISIKGTTTDGLGIAGGGGVAAWAIAGAERAG